MVVKKVGGHTQAKVPFMSSLFQAFQPTCRCSSRFSLFGPLTVPHSKHDDQTLTSGSFPLNSNMRCNLSFSASSSSGPFGLGRTTGFSALSSSCSSLMVSACFLPGGGNTLGATCFLTPTFGTLTTGFCIQERDSSVRVHLQLLYIGSELEGSTKSPRKRF